MWEAYGRGSREAGKEQEGEGEVELHVGIASVAGTSGEKRGDGEGRAYIGLGRVRRAESMVGRCDRNTHGRNDGTAVRVRTTDAISGPDNYHPGPGHRHRHSLPRRRPVRCPPLRHTRAHLARGGPLVSATTLAYFLLRKRARTAYTGVRHSILSSPLLILVLI